MNYCDVEWFALETNRDHSVTFVVAPKYCILFFVFVFFFLEFQSHFIFFNFFKFYFIFKLYKIVLVLPNIKMNPPQVSC